MSLAGLGTEAGLGPESGGPLSHVWKEGEGGTGEGKRVPHAPCLGGGVVAVQARCNASWVMVTWGTPVEMFFKIQQIFSLRV